MNRTRPNNESDPASVGPSIRSTLVPGHEQFVTTNWSLVVKARKGSVETSHSLATLCAEYWFPLYTYLRQKGASTHDAEDLIQAFFTWLLASDLVDRADRERGRFRTFLLVALRQFCARQHRWSNAQKRSPPTEAVSLDLATAEARYDKSLVNEWTPEKLFDHSWAITVLDVAMRRLREEFEESGRSERFEAMAPFLTDESRSGREANRQQLGVSEAAFAMALSRMRRRFGSILYEEVARTVGETDDVEDKLKQILAAISP